MSMVWHIPELSLSTCWEVVEALATLRDINMYLK